MLLGLLLTRPGLARAEVVTIVVVLIPQHGPIFEAAEVEGITAAPVGLFIRVTLEMIVGRHTSDGTVRCRSADVFDGTSKSEVSTKGNDTQNGYVEKC